MQRLAKFISQAGVCSRRAAEELISRGEVKVDGIVITSPATNVNEQNKVEISGKIITINNKPQIWIYYKPAGLITTHKDPQGRPTVFANLKNLPRVISVGRLDLNSEGLLLLTNSGKIARYLELPAHKIERVYKVRVHGKFDLTKIKLAEKGINIEMVKYKPSAINLLSRKGDNSWFEVKLLEGKNREIRKIFNHYGLQVSRLIRLRYGPFELGNLKPGEVKEASPNLVKNIIGKIEE